MFSYKPRDTLIPRGLHHSLTELMASFIESKPTLAAQHKPNED